MSEVTALILNSHHNKDLLSVCPQCHHTHHSVPLVSRWQNSNLFTMCLNCQICVNFYRLHYCLVWLKHLNTKMDWKPNSDCLVYFNEAAMSPGLLNNRSIWEITRFQWLMNTYPCQHRSKPNSHGSKSSNHGSTDTHGCMILHHMM